MIPETVQGQLQRIKDDITHRYFSEQAVANTVNNILYGLERLEISLKQASTQMRE